MLSIDSKGNGEIIFLISKHVWKYVTIVFISLYLFYLKSKFFIFFTGILKSWEVNNVNFY